MFIITTLHNISRRVGLKSGTGARAQGPCSVSHFRNSDNSHSVERTISRTAATACHVLKYAHMPKRDIHTFFCYKASYSELQVDYHDLVYITDS